eukprot:scaffold260_cov274-Pinguiococcus_pyrenoidosus.AAC.18
MVPPIKVHGQQVSKAGTMQGTGDAESACDLRIAWRCRRCVFTQDRDVPLAREDASGSIPFFAPAL